MSDNEEKPAGIDFLDFLFTVSIGIGLTPEILGMDYIKGLLSENWVRNGQLPSSPDLYNLGVFILGFLTLTLSWFGYHGSMAKKPIKYGTVSGMFRFIFDVLLVIIYGLILLEFRNFKVVLTLLVIVHFIFVIWDVIKIIEHRDKYLEKAGGHLQRYRREYVSGLFFVLFFILYLSYTLCLYSYSLGKWLSLILAIIFTVFYRINKDYVIWERCFGVKSD